MRKIILLLWVLFLYLSVASQTAEVTEFYYEGGIRTTPLKVMVLDSIARPIWKVQILAEYDLITDYKYLPDRNTEGEYYSIQYPDSLAENGFLVRSLKNQKVAEERKYNIKGESIGYTKYKHENEQLVYTSVREKSETRDTITHIEKKLSYDEQGKIQKEEIYLDGKLMNLIEYSHSIDIVKIYSQPTMPNSKSFKELYVFNEVGQLITFQKTWGTTEEAQFKPKDRIKKYFKYNKKGFLKTATYEAYQDQELKPFLTITMAYEIAPGKKFDKSLYPTIIEKALQFTLEEAWNYKKYGW